MALLALESGVSRQLLMSPLVPRAGRARSRGLPDFALSQGLLRIRVELTGRREIDREMREGLHTVARVLHPPTSPQEDPQG